MEYGIKNSIKNKTLYELFFRQRNVLIDISLMAIAVILLAVLANIIIPLWPVPITGQTFGVFIIAFFFGSRKGLATMALYVLAGILGLGVFAGHKSGLAAMLGPTAGYIFGFFVCIFAVGLLIEKGYGRTKSSIIGIMALGSIIIYFFGIIGLGNYLKTANIWILLTKGVFPFLIGDALKIGAALALFPYVWKKGEAYSSLNYT